MCKIEIVRELIILLVFGGDQFLNHVNILFYSSNILSYQNKSKTNQWTITTASERGYL